MSKQEAVDIQAVGSDRVYISVWQRLFSYDNPQDQILLADEDPRKISSYRDNSCSA